MLTGESTITSSLLILHLNDGRVSLSIQSIITSLEASTMSRYNDSQPHTLQFTLDGEDFSLVVDGTEQPTIMGITGKCLNI